MKLCLVKVGKSDACIRPLFANSVTYRAIEKVERRASRIVPKFREYSYNDRLMTLNLPSLDYRRRRMDIIK